MQESAVNADTHVGTEASELKLTALMQLWQVLRLASVEETKWYVLWTL